jgi:hypothetical protein
MGWSGEEGEVDMEGEVRRRQRWPIAGEEDWTGLAARQRWSDRNLKKIRKHALDGILRVISKRYPFGRTYEAREAPPPGAFFGLLENYLLQ